MVKETGLLSRDIGYSVRRYFVDRFYFDKVAGLQEGGCVLDLGGNKTEKRGRFDIDDYDLRVVYGNLSPLKKPHVLLEAEHVPFGDSCFDAVICSEVLEHVSEPRNVLAEACRILRASGVLLVSVPFLFRIHGDPKDYGRYTHFYWIEMLAEIGFRDIEVEKHGLFWSVLMEMLRSFLCHLIAQQRIRQRWVRRCLAALVNRGVRKALEVEAKPDHRHDLFMSSFTTGFGIKALKR